MVSILWNCKCFPCFYNLFRPKFFFKLPAQCFFRSFRAGPHDNHCITMNSQTNNWCILLVTRSVGFGDVFCSKSVGTKLMIGLQVWFSSILMWCLGSFLKKSTFLRGNKVGCIIWEGIITNYKINIFSHSISYKEPIIKAYYLTVHVFTMIIHLFYYVIKFRREKTVLAWGEELITQH